MKSTFLIAGILLILLSGELYSAWEKIQVESSNPFIKKLRVIDKNNYMGISNSKFYRTEDNAVNWISNMMGNVVVYDMNNRGRDTIYIVGNNYSKNNGFFHKSFDGGKNWNYIPLDTTTLPSLLISDIALPNSRTIFICGDYDVIYKSTDEGGTWSISWTGNDKRSFRSISFACSDTGYVLGSQKNGLGLNRIVFRTTNAGTTWDSLTIFKDANLRKLQAVSSQIIYLSGQDSLYEAVYKSTDAGMTWTKVWKSQMHNTGIYSMYFVDKNIGFIGGEEGAVYRTRDGGGSWNAIPTGVSSSVGEICFLNDYFGFASAGSNFFRWDNTANVPKISVNTNSLDFGTVDLKKFSNKIIEITNEGKENLRITNVWFEYEGLNDSSFSTNAKMPIMLIPGGFYDLNITYFCRKYPIVKANLFIESNDPIQPITKVSIIGKRGKSPKIELKQSFVDFGNVDSGKIAYQKIYIYNTGTQNLELKGLSYGYEISNDSSFYHNIVFPEIISPGDYFELVMAFTPKSRLYYKVDLYIETNDPDSSSVKLRMLGTTTDAVAVEDKSPEERRINLYPNPASDYIEISASDVILSGAKDPCIYDVLGMMQLDTPPDPLFLEGGKCRIDVSGLAPGVYFVRVGNIVRKFVKHN